MAEKSSFSSRNAERFSPVTRVSFFLGEAFRRVWISRRSSSVAIFMIALSLVIVGFFLLISNNLQTAVERVGSASRMTIYLDVDADPGGIALVASKLRTTRGFDRFREVTPREAMSRFRTYFRHLGPVVDDLGTNPFPHSFEVELARRTIESPGFSRSVNEIRAISAVDTIEYDWQWTQRLRRAATIIDTAGLIIGGILALAASFMIANVIKLTMLLYREEIEIMRLVGATERTVRGPFLIEGLIQGVAGAAVAVALLAGGHAIATRSIEAENALLFEALFRDPLPPAILAMLAAGGIAAGLAGSWLSLREYADPTEI
jgi:cell division transport system permease protein